MTSPQASPQEQALKLSPINGAGRGYSYSRGACVVHGTHPTHLQCLNPLLS